jgi:hypothetical protein
MDIIKIPEQYVIHDTRSPNDFKGITICGYKRTDVIAAYQNAMINNKLEDAIRWCTELHSTGLNQVIWNSLHLIYMKYIHINHPKFLIYLLKREKEYNRIIEKYNKKHEIFSRNEQEIRNLYCELTSISAITKKNNLFLQKSLPSITHISFQQSEIKKRIISKNLYSITDYVYNTTPNDTKFALNEIITNLSKGTFENCIYWYLWLEKIENNKKKEKTKHNAIKKDMNIINQLNGKNIVYSNKDLGSEPYYDLWVFMIWNMILSFKNNISKNNFILIDKLHSLYKKNFKVSKINSRKYYIFIAFYVIRKKLNWNIPLYQTEYLIIQTNANINSMYYNIIKNIEVKLSEDEKKIIRKKYYTELLNQEKKSVLPKKIKNTEILNEDINIIEYTKHPEYKDFSQPYSSIEENDFLISPQELVYKNKTKKDVIDEKEEKKNKQLEIFLNLIPKKIEKKQKININSNSLKNIYSNTNNLNNNDLNSDDLNTNDLNTNDSNTNDSNNNTKFKEITIEKESIENIYKNIEFSKKK